MISSYPSRDKSGGEGGTWLRRAANDVTVGGASARVQLPDHLLRRPTRPALAGHPCPRCAQAEGTVIFSLMPLCPTFPAPLLFPGAVRIVAHAAVLVRGHRRIVRSFVAIFPAARIVYHRLAAGCGARKRRGDRTSIPFRRSTSRLPRLLRQSGRRVQSRKIELGRAERSFQRKSAGHCRRRQRQTADISRDGAAPSCNRQPPAPCASAARR